MPRKANKFKDYILENEIELRQWYLDNHDVLESDITTVDKWLETLSYAEVIDILKFNEESDPFDEYERYDD